MLFWSAAPNARIIKSCTQKMLRIFCIFKPDSRLLLSGFLHTKTPGYVNCTLIRVQLICRGFKRSVSVPYVKKTFI